MKGKKATSVWQYLKWTRSDQAKMKEKLEKLPQTNERASQNEVLLQKCYRKVKSWGSPLYKILGTILKMDKGGTWINGPEDPKVDDYVQGVTSPRWHWETVCVKKRDKKIGPTSIEDGVNASLQGLNCPVGWGCRIHRLLLCRGVRPPPNECPGYDTKQSYGEVPAMLELWEMQSTPSLPSLPGPLWPGVVAPDMGPIYALNRTKPCFFHYTDFCI